MQQTSRTESVRRGMAATLDMKCGVHGRPPHGFGAIVVSIGARPSVPTRIARLFAPATGETQMASNLQVDNPVSTTAQSVKDQNGRTSPLALSTDKVGIEVTNGYNG
jgi:hypothetical protein